MGENPYTFSVLPEDFWKWRFVERNIHLVANLFNFKEIRTSILQDALALQRSFVGGLIEKGGLKLADLVFQINNNEALCLRPESTITVLQSEIGKRAKDEVQKVYYYGPIFRTMIEKKRQHQVFQFGFEILGNSSEVADIEIMRIGIRICDKLGIPNPRLKLNNYGCEKCRPAYRTAMREFLDQPAVTNCGRCDEETLFNPFQRYTCDNGSCVQLETGAPRMIDYLCDDCQNNQSFIQRILSNIMTDYETDPYLHRSFGYYNRNVFSLVTEIDGVEVELGGGGRYDYLSRNLLQEQIPAVGFSLEMDRVIDVMQRLHLLQEPETPFSILVCAASRELDMPLFQIVIELHDHNYPTIMELSYKGKTALRKKAKSEDVALVILITEQTIREGKVLLMNLIKDHEELISLSDILDTVERYERSLRYQD